MILFKPSQIKIKLRSTDFYPRTTFILGSHFIFLIASYKIQTVL